VSCYYIFRLLPVRPQLPYSRLRYLTPPRYRDSTAALDVRDFLPFLHRCCLRSCLVGLVDYAAIFPACCAVVHHGGAGTTAAGLRAGMPTLILWTWADQPLWAAAVKRLKVGSARRFSSTTQESLVADLRTILAPQYATRAREIATQMTKPAESVTAAADLLENSARLRRFG
jgi:hypothetical protein